ncbi:MAG: hypothetical protein HC884_08795 [Chloroflexaceae bacterium]|nr:hypothetical protein [Chloroflexaceae bacterium]
MPKIVRDGDRNCYRLEEEEDIIGKGQTSLVYKASCVVGYGEGGGSIPGKTYAVKLARESASVHTFKEESELLQEIRRRSGDRFCVEARMGYVEHEPSRPALIMDLVPSDWEIRQHVSKDEAACLSMAEQYVELLEVVHEQIRRTCNDRKVGDFYWNPEYQQLIILDWNVTHPRPPVDPTSPLTPEQDQQKQDDRRRVQTDIANFAGIWYELVTSEDSREVPGMDDPSPPSWAGLARGTRRLIWQALEGAGPRRYTTATVWLEDIRWFREVFRVGTTDPQDLLTRAERLRDNPGQEPATEDRIEDILDLIEHRASWLKNNDERFGQLQAWLREPAQAAARAIQEAREAIGQGKEANAIASLGAALTRERLDAETRLRLRRWLLLAQAMKQAADQHISMRDVRDNLIAILDDFEKGDWQAAEQKVPARLQDPDTYQTSYSKRYLQILQTELKIRQKVRQAERIFRNNEQLSGSGNDRFQRLQQGRDSAQEAITEVENQLALLHTTPEYQKALEDTLLPNMHERLASLQQALEVERQREAERSKWRERTSRINRILSEKELPISERAERLKNALHFLEEEKKPPQDAEFEREHQAFEHLLRLVEVVAPRKHRMVLYWLGKMEEHFQGWELLEPVKSWCLPPTIGYIRQLLTNTPRWPQEVDEGIDLLNLLELVVDEDRNLWLAEWKDQDKWKEFLDKRQKRQQELRGRCGGGNVLKDLDNHNYDEALREALKEGIELFDWSRDEDRSVGRLLVQRETERLHRGLATLTGGDLAEVQQGVITAQGTLEGINTSLSELQTKIEELNQQVSGQGDFQQRLVEAAVGRLEAPGSQIQRKVEEQVLQGLPLQVLPAIEKESKRLQEELKTYVRSSIQEEIQRQQNPWAPIAQDLQRQTTPDPSGSSTPPELPSLMGRFSAALVAAGDPPELHRTSLQQSLGNIYENQKEKAAAPGTDTTSFQNLVWSGLWCFRVRESSQGHHENPQEAQKKVKNVARLLKLKKRDFQRLDSHFQELVNCTRRDPRGLAEDVAQEVARPGSSWLSWLFWLLRLVMVLSMAGIGILGFGVLITPSHMVLDIGKSTLPADGQSTTTITATTYNLFGNRLPSNSEVTFALRGPTGTEEDGNLDDSSPGTARFQAGTRPGQVEVIARASNRLSRNVVLTLLPPDLRVSIEATTPRSQSFVLPGEVVGFSPMVQTESTFLTRSVQLRCSIPRGTQLHASSHENDVRSGEDWIEWGLGTLGGNQEVQRDFSVEIPASTQPISSTELTHVTCEARDANGRIYPVQRNLNLAMVPPVPSAITLTILPASSVQANGTNQINVKATVQDQAGKPVPDGTEVTFTLVPQPRGVEPFSGTLSITNVIPLTPTFVLSQTTIIAQIELVSDTRKIKTGEGSAVWEMTVGTIPAAIQVTASVEGEKGPLSATEQLEQQPCGNAAVAEGGANVRSSPEGARDENIITSLPGGARVDFLCEYPADQPGWARVLLVTGPGTVLEGWVSDELLIPNP